MKKTKFNVMKIDSRKGGTDVFLASLLIGVLTSFKMGYLSLDEVNQYLVNPFFYDLLQNIEALPEIQICFMDAMKLGDVADMGQLLIEDRTDKILKKCFNIINDKSKTTHPIKKWNISRAE